MRGYWLYEGLGAPIWVHRDNERVPERRLVFVLEATCRELEQRRPRSRIPGLLAHRRAGELRSLHVTGPAPASLPSYDGPAIEYSRGPHHLELVIGNGPRRRITDTLVLTGCLFPSAPCGDSPDHHPPVR